jgi:2-oxoglutarate dehydrogenase E2 component (dihydrolipoamide succinyltransferase)
VIEEMPVEEMAEGKKQGPAEIPSGEAEPIGETTRALVTPVRATPIAERMASETGVDLHQIHPASPDQRITKQDVQEFLEKQQHDVIAPPGLKDAPAPREVTSPQPSAKHDRAAREERVRMSRRRQTIGRRLVEAQHAAAMLTTFNEVDMTAVLALRQRRKEAFKQRYGVSLGITSFFVKAAIGALKAFPKLNAEIQGDEMVLKHYYDIGIAVGAEEGLVVPVLRDADYMSFAEIEKAIGEFVEKAETGKLSIEDLRGGTFTITNGGIFGSLLSTPILNPPQVGILGLHKFEERPIAREGQVVIRSMMYVALSYDHRIVDGREAVQFLVRVKELTEDPASLLLEG